MKRGKKYRLHPVAGKIAIIMPAYNEGASISNTISEINSKIIRKMPGTKLFVFEDGSIDNTKTVLRRLKSKYAWLEVHLGPERLGYPRAVKNAFKSIDARKFNYILFTDSDGQYYPEDFFKLLAEMERTGADMVVAERKNRAEPFYRVILSNGLHLIEHALFNVPYDDITSALRLMKTKECKEVADDVRFSKYNFWLEFAARASKARIKTASVKVRYRERGDGGSTKVYRIDKLPKIVLNELGAVVKIKLEK